MVQIAAAVFILRLNDGGLQLLLRLLCKSAVAFVLVP